MSRMRVVCLCILALTLGLGACNWIAPPAQPTKLRMMMSAEEPSLNRMTRTSNDGEPIWDNVLEPLFKLGKAGALVPALATAVEPSEDLTTWRFSLRKGVRFHNGDDFSSKDVVETVKWLLDVKELSGLHSRVPIERAVAVDDHTVELVFAKPQPLLPINIRTLLIYPASIAQGNREAAETSVLGTGPYSFVKWDRGQSITLKKFENYWGPKPQIDEVEIIIRAEESVRLAALQAGEVDWIINLGPDLASRAPKVVSVASPDTVWLRFDEYLQKEHSGRESILADKRLRLAIQHSIDPRALVSIYGGKAFPSQGQFASPGEFGFDPKLVSRPYDLETARDLVRQAGAVGTTVTFTSGAGTHLKDRESAQAISHMIEQSGLKVELRIVPEVERRRYYRTVSPEEKSFKSDIHLAGSDALLEVETRFPQIFVERGTYLAITDPEPTRLYREAVAERNYDQRAEKVGAAWAYVYEQAHYVPLFRLPWIWGLAANVEWEPPLTGIPYAADIRITK